MTTSRHDRRDLQFLRLFDELRQLIQSVGPPCWATGPTAAALVGFDGYALERPFHLAVPYERSPHREGAVVHRLRGVDRIDRATAFDVPCLSPTRVLIELAATESPAQLTAALDSALRDGGTSEDFLHRRIVELRGHGRAGLSRLLAVIEGAEVTRGGHSYLERAFLAYLAEVELPRPQTQSVLTKRGDKLIRVDCVYSDRRLVIELLGYRFHRTKMQMQVDAERLNRLQLEGYTVVQFTYTDVVTRSDHMRATLTDLFPSLVTPVADATVNSMKPTSASVNSQKRSRRKWRRSR